MFDFIRRYTHWLHSRWPAGHVEQLPVVNPDGSTNVPGLYVVGDITGIPLLKFSSDTGARSVRTILDDPSFQARDTADPEVLDLVVIGSGVSGVAAMAVAKDNGLRAEILEASEPFSTIVNFPKGKPIYTYPKDMEPAGDLQFEDERTEQKEGLVEHLEDFKQEHGIEPRMVRAERVERKGGLLRVLVAEGDPLRAHRVIVAIGRSGNHRRLGVAGEDLDKVYNRLHDPADYCGQICLVVGGGDSALETAIALATCGAEVTLSYRKPEFSRPKPENIEKILALSESREAEASVDDPSSERVTSAAGDWMSPRKKRGSITLRMPTNVKEIREDEVDLEDDEGNVETIENDVVFSMIGREPPLDFFRRSGVKVQGDRGWWWWTSLSAFLLFCFWLYHWKGEKPIPFAGYIRDFAPWLSPDPRSWISNLQSMLGDWASSRANPIGVLLNSAQGPAFYYTLGYSIIVVIFGIRRIRYRRSPYITLQTSVLMAIQVIPLFLLPELILPWLDGLGVFEAGAGKWVASTFFPGDSWWRAYGLILAWPLMAWNIFTSQPIWGWIVLGSLQTFVIIPGMIYFWGKGAYCGWICSCGALAETLGDRHRHKMPHGPQWNRLNMAGQVIMVAAFMLLILRIIGWIVPGSWADNLFQVPALGSTVGGTHALPGINYAWFVDLFLAGVLGYGLYFWFSGRVWCRFFCPLAALMHIYARFSRFRIIADKKKCISCNICTSVCHQGIDVMSFANKGLHMADPECVRCSACVQSCPTGVLQFGQVDRRSGDVIRYDKLAASPILMREGVTVEGKPTT